MWVVFTFHRLWTEGCVLTGPSYEETVPSVEPALGWCIRFVCGWYYSIQIHQKGLALTYSVEPHRATWPAWPVVCPKYVGFVVWMYNTGAIVFCYFHFRPSTLPTRCEPLIQVSPWSFRSQVLIDNHVFNYARQVHADDLGSKRCTICFIAITLEGDTRVQTTPSFSRLTTGMSRAIRDGYQDNTMLAQGILNCICLLPSGLNND